MNEEVLTLYGTYFQNADNNYKVFVDKLTFHHCYFCSEPETVKAKHCKTDVTKIILVYLNHLKLMCAPWKKVKYFLRSIKISGFLADDCLGKWTMIKWKEKDIFILCRIK